MIANWTNRVTDITTTTNEHGYESLDATIRMTAAEAFRFYAGLDVVNLVLSDGATTVFEGRIEDTAVIDGGIQITAFGYWRAYFDVPYTALWSDSTLRYWQLMPDGETAKVYQLPPNSTTPVTSGSNEAKTARFGTDKNGRLWITPTTGEIFVSTATTGNFCMYYYQVPTSGARDILEIDITYSCTLATGHRFVLYAYDANFVIQEALLDISVTTGTTTTTLTLAAAMPIIGVVYQFDVNNTTITGRTGTNFINIEAIRVKSSSSATLTASEIAAAMVTHISGVNSDQVTDTDVLITDPGVDLFDEYYNDVNIADELTRFARLGDDSTPPKRFEVGVWERRILHLRERGSDGRKWSVDSNGFLNIRRSLDRMYNSVYAVYEQPKEQLPQRTATSADATSPSQYQLTRRLALSARTTDSAQAVIQRDAALDDLAQPISESSLDTSSIYTNEGVHTRRAYYPKSGDEITIRDITPTAGAAVDRIKTFIIHRTQYSPLSDTIVITPEYDAPTLTAIVAQNSEAISR